MEHGWIKMFDTPLRMRLQQYYAPYISRIITAYLTIFSDRKGLRCYGRKHRLRGNLFNNSANGLWMNKRQTIKIMFFHEKWHGKHEWIRRLDSVTVKKPFVWVDHRKNGILHGKEYRRYMNKPRTYRYIKYWKEGNPIKTHTWYNEVGDLKARVEYLADHEQGYMFNSRTNEEIYWKARERTGKSFTKNCSYAHHVRNGKTAELFDPFKTAYDIHIIKHNNK